MSTLVDVDMLHLDAGPTLPPSPRLSEVDSSSCAIRADWTANRVMTSKSTPGREATGAEDRAIRCVEKASAISGEIGTALDSPVSVSRYWRPSKYEPGLYSTDLATHRALSGKPKLRASRIKLSS
jgi:hypothetical protein